MLNILILLAALALAPAHASDQTAARPLYWGLITRADVFQTRGRHRADTSDLMAQESMKMSAYGRYRKAARARLRNAFGRDRAYAELAQRTTITPPDADFGVVWRFVPERSRTRLGFTTIHQTLRVLQTSLIVSDHSTELTPHPFTASISALGAENKILVKEELGPADVRLVDGPGGFELKLMPSVAERVRGRLTGDPDLVEDLELTLSAHRPNATLRTWTPADARRYLGFEPKPRPAHHVLLKLPKLRLECQNALGGTPERWPFTFAPRLDVGLPRVD